MSHDKHLLPVWCHHCESEDVAVEVAPVRSAGATEDRIVYTCRKCNTSWITPPRRSLPHDQVRKAVR